MRFRSKQKPRGILKARDQRNLTLMILGFGVVLFCFNVVRRPAFWARIFPDDASSVVVNETTSDESLQPSSEKQPASVLQHDEFLMKTTSSGDGVSVTANRIPFDEAQPTATTSGIPKIPDDLLEMVKDDVIGIHSTESQAYFAGLKLASLVDSRKMRNAPAGAFALFMDSPNGSRGLPWKIEGQLRRLAAVRGQSNAFGVGTIYDAWVTTPDSGSQLIHVVSQSADESLKNLLAGNVEQTGGPRMVEFLDRNAPQVTFTGYFFKREGYASRQGISLAPLLLAGTIRQVVKPVVTSTRAEELTPYLGWLTLAVCVGVVFMIWSFTMSDAVHSRTRTHELTRLPAHMSFEGVTSMTIGEMLSEITSGTSTTGDPTAEPWSQHSA
ncbi:MAG: hypothetical protein KDA81_04285 [Planctomycetaceae bacterium]|nr:hypothetical protein [Planctomycetaceae bacterium]